MFARLFAAVLIGASLPVVWGAALLPLLCLTRPLCRRALHWAPPVLLAFLTGAWQSPAGVPPIDPESTTALEGWMASRPRRNATFGSWRGVLHVDHVTLAAGTDSSRTLAAPFRVVVRSRQPLPAYGSRLFVEGRLVAPRARRNFHGWDERAFLRARDARGTFYARRVIRVAGRRGNVLRRDVVEPLRSRLAAAAEDVVSEPACGLQKALLLGIRDTLDPRLEDAWRSLGMSHVLALSGMHVGVVAAALLVLSGNLRTLRGVVVMLCGVFGYAALGGWGASVLRASLMVACVGIASFLGRARNALRSLGIAAVLFLAVSPHRVDDLGFQLSCSATLGILVAVPPLAGWARRQRGRSPARTVLAWVISVAAVGIAAQIATLPWILHHFGLVSWMSPLTNLLFVPCVDLALILGLTAAVATLLLPPVARPLWLVSAALLHGVTWLSLRAVEHLEPRIFLRNDISVVAWAAVAAVAFVLGLRGGGRRRVVLLALASACLIATFVQGNRAASPAWGLDMLDVGQGDALLLRLGNDNWLIDAGPTRPMDQGTRVILPHLRRQGIDHLRGVVVSHPHADHHGGIPSVLRAVRVDTVYVAAASQTDPVYTAWRRALPDIPQRGVRSGERLSLDGETVAWVLWPPATDVLGSGANGVSVTLWVRSPDGPSLLLMGDLEQDGEQRLLRRWGDVLRHHQSEFLILKAGHHGSDTSSSAAFLDAIDAEVALISAGRRNRYGHPSPQTLRALRLRSCVTLRTDRGGDIGLEQRGDVLWLQRPTVRRTILAQPGSALTAFPPPD